MRVKEVCWTTPSFPPFYFARVLAIPFVTPGLSSTRKQPHYSARASSTNLTRKRRGTSRGALLYSFDYPAH